MLQGGSEFKGETVDEYKRKEKEEEVQYRLPFGGGSGAGISINPVAFVLVQKDSIKVVPIEHSSAIDKLMDYVPDIMEKANKTNIADKILEEDQKNEKNKNVNQSNTNKMKSKKIKIYDNKSNPEKIETETEEDEYFDEEEN